MAIYHVHVQVIGRSSGRSAVAAAAYRSGSKLHDERIGRSHDFTAKAGVVHSEILLPDGAPERWRDRQYLWNEVEACERRKDAQLARELEVALPRELSREEGIRLVRDFVTEQFVARRMVADVNVHWDVAADGGPKPHAHIMLTMRQAGPDGFGAKVREWNSAELYAGVRERWASLVNERLAELGHEVRIDHRSYAEQGIALEPQNKIGPAGVRRVERGESAERADEHREIARRNGERILEDPSLVLAALTRQHSTFTRTDLARFVNRHSDGAEQFASVLAKVEASPEIVRLGEDGRGRERLTTRTMLAVERRMEDAAEALGEGRRHGVPSWAQDGALRRAAGRGLQLGDEQRDGLRHVTSERGLSLVVGYAGTGKSAMLGVAREAWEGQGYAVRGAALSGIAAEGLEAGSGIGSRTLHAWEHAWGQGRELLTSRDVLVVDEAGMVGSRQLEQVLGHAREAGAKVVLVGDPEQLQAIEAGAAFRALSERHGAAEITTVLRQREAWQRQATRELATGRTAEALGRYEQAGMVQRHDSREEAKAALVAGWDEARRRSPSQVILAVTRADVRDLNELVRAKLREAGELGAEVTVTTERGARAFAAGDRVMFLRNERGMGVKNGTLGKVERVDARGLTVRLDGAEGRRVGFELKDYAHVDHGYAATVYKAQGVTVDRAHVLATGHLDRHGTYTALTRHRDGVQLHYAREELADGRQLAFRLGRERAKDTTLDYAEGFAERRGIIPQSEIVVRQAPAERSGAGLRRGMFAGLRLPATTAARTPVPVPPTGLERAVAGYARAWGDARRMEEQHLPVLPHQLQALAVAAVALERQAPGIRRDLEAALSKAPGLVPKLGSVGEVRVLVEAATTTRRERTAAEQRAAIRAVADRMVAERFAATWRQLEQRQEQLVRFADRPEREAIAARLDAMEVRLERDPELQAALRRHERRLEMSAGLSRALRGQERDRDRGLDLGR